MILHGASENFFMKEQAATIHRSMGFKGNLPVCPSNKRGDLVQWQTP